MGQKEITIGGKTVDAQLGRPKKKKAKKKSVKSSSEVKSKKSTTKKKRYAPPPAEKKKRRPRVPSSQKNITTTGGKFATEDDALRESARVNQAVNRSARYKSTNIRDICEAPEGLQFTPLNLKGINWERRMACKRDPILDLETYMPKVFYLGWATYQKNLVYEIEERIQEGGKKAFGCPRGGGKTGICRGMIIRATKYGMRKFAFFIGSKEPKAIQTLDFIKGYWYRSSLLRQDFPEIAYPVYRIEGRGGMGVHGQIFRGERTHINWSSKEVQYPCMLFDEEDVEDYLQYDPDCVTWLPDIGVDIQKFIINSAGVLIRVAGIDGSIRGEADLHPITLAQPRPDLVLMDDVQKDQRADSPKSCNDLERLIESAIDYLAAPDIAQACLMPCTVIREGDVADRYLNPMEKPDYGGERHGIVEVYPQGIDDDVILDEVNGVPNPQGKFWLENKDLREKSLREKGNLKLCNDHYKKNRKVMDEGFEVSWEQRYKTDSPNEDKNEISAIQAAMYWRFKDHFSYLSEGQNKPRSRVDATGLLLTAAEVSENVTNIIQEELSSQWTNIVAFIDVQDEILFYTLFAHDHAFNGQFIDYGTFPQVNTNYFRKSQTYGWVLLTREYYKEFPRTKPSNLTKTKQGKLKAPFEAKIYLALKQCCSWLLSRKFLRNDEHQSLLGIKALAIDTRWGKSSETIKRFVREFADRRVITYNGHPFMPSHKQLEEYTDTPGWLFEHNQFPHVKESKWVVKPVQGGGQTILADVNRLKSFLMKRLSTPQGEQASITLFNSSPEKHRMFADQVAGSEVPEPIQARGIIKDCWVSRPERREDNDYLDCATGCMALAGICGASIKSDETNVVSRKRRSLKQVYRDKKRHTA